MQHSASAGTVDGLLPIVPAPVRARALDAAAFTVTPATTVVAAPGAQAPAAVVARALGAGGARVPEVRPAPDEPAAAGLVVLTLTDDVPAGDEAYRLTSGADGVRLEARTVDGLHRAAATLGQLVTVDGGAVTVTAAEVEDAPRFGWRGLCVDVARHFLPVADVEVIVDLVAAYKLNVLHVHLTDDQGWRIDLPSWPELAERSSGSAVDGGPGGCYTAEDWASLVAYAAARGVAVVPEIDVPGHTNAALHALPELTPSGEAPAVYTGIGVGFSGLRPELPATGPFLRDVFGDLAAMTPGAYLHIGGDEALEMRAEDYVALVGTAVAAVDAAGRSVVAWQEAAAAPLPPGSVLQYWLERADPAPLLAAVDAGARVVMSPASRVYLDIKHTPDDELGQDWAGHTELRDAYEWDPATYLPGLDPAAVAGVEATVWTETLRTLDDVTSMLLPRLAAVAEVAWSSGTDWEDFRARVAQHAAAWDRLGLAWYASPQVDWDR